MDTRRRSASNLAFAAAFVTLTLASVALASQGHQPVRIWLVAVTLPTVVAASAAALQYRFGRHSGAGAAAASIAWAFLMVTNVRALTLFLPAVTLLTIAWWQGRPRGAARA